MVLHNETNRVTWLDSLVFEEQADLPNFLGHAPVGKAFLAHSGYVLEDDMIWDTL